MLKKEDVRLLVPGTKLIGIRAGGGGDPRPVLGEPRHVILEEEYEFVAVDEPVDPLLVVKYKGDVLPFGLDYSRFKLKEEEKPMEKIPYVPKVGDKVRMLWPSNVNGEGKVLAGGGPIPEVVLKNGIYTVSYTADSWVRLKENTKWVYAFEAIEKVEEEQLPLPVVNAALSYREAYARAKELKIPNRSAMSKRELNDAIAAIIKPPAPVVKAKPAPVVPKPIHELSLGDELRKCVEVKGVGTCSYAFEYIDKDQRRVFNVGDVCHARLRTNHPVSAVCLDVAGHHKNLVISKLGDEYKAWVKYMLNDSMLAKYFKTKNVEEAMKHSVYLDVDVANTYTGALSAIALREGSEYKQRLKPWNELVKEGFNPRIAWVYTYLFVDGKYNGNTGAHQIVSSGHSFERFMEFVANGPPESQYTKSSYNKTSGIYAIFNTVLGGDQWGIKGEKSVDATIPELFGFKPKFGFDGVNTKLSKRQIFMGLEKLESIMLLKQQKQAPVVK
jgi:hypothetical protein